MPKTPVVIDRSQKRLGDFFKQYARQASPSSQLATPQRPGASSQMNPGEGTSGASTSGEKRRRSDIHEDGDSGREVDEDGESSDDCLVLGGRALKSPRRSPEPSSAASHGRPINSSFRIPPGIVKPGNGVNDANNVSSPLSSNDIEETSSSATARPYSSASRAPAASFASTGSFASSSQRVVRNGETVAVKNSDDENTDDSIDELDDLLGLRNPPAKLSSPLTELSHTPSPPPDLFSDNNRRMSTRLRHQRPPDDRTVQSKPERKVTFSLAALTQRARRENELKLDVEQTLNRIRELDEARELADGKSTASLEELVKHHGPEEGRERFMEALERTEALHQTKKQWYFFDYAKYGRMRMFERDHLQALRDGQTDLLRRLLEDDYSFHQALNSGIFLKIAKKGRLPAQYADVLFEMAIQTVRRDIHEACLSILEHVEWGSETAGKIFAALRALGAREKAMSSRQPLQPMPASSESEAKMRRGNMYLSNILRLVARFPGRYTTEHKDVMLDVLFRLAADDVLRSDVALRTDLSDAMFAFLSGLPDVDGDVARDLFSLTADDFLRLKILDIIPVTVPAICLLRRRLAAAWFFDDVKQVVTPVSTMDGGGDDGSHSELELVLKQLVHIPSVIIHFSKRPDIFDISKDTDYLRLKSKIQLLNIALGNGDFTSPSLPVDNLTNNSDTSPTPTNPTDHKDPSSSTKPSPSPSISKPSRRAFDASIDRLATSIRTLSADIIDTGASHASRIESKDALDSLHSRLLYVVRTRVRARRDIINDNGGNGGVLDDDDDGPGQRGISRYFKSKVGSGVGEGGGGRC